MINNKGWSRGKKGGGERGEGGGKGEEYLSSVGNVLFSTYRTAPVTGLTDKTINYLFRTKETKLTDNSIFEIHARETADKRICLPVYCLVLLNLLCISFLSIKFEPQ